MRQVWTPVSKRPANGSSALKNAYFVYTLPIRGQPKNVELPSSRTTEAQLGVSEYSLENCMSAGAACFNLTCHFLKSADDVPRETQSRLRRAAFGRG